MGRGIKICGALWLLLLATATLTGGCGNGQPYMPLSDAQSDFQGGDFGDTLGEPLEPLEETATFHFRQAGVNCDASLPGVRATITSEGGTVRWKDLCLGYEKELSSGEYVASSQNLGIVYQGFLYLKSTFTQPRVACAFTGLDLLVVHQDDSGLILSAGLGENGAEMGSVQQGFVGGSLYFSHPDGFQLQVPTGSPWQSWLSLSAPGYNYSGPASCLLF